MVVAASEQVAAPVIVAESPSAPRPRRRALSPDKAARRDKVVANLNDPPVIPEEAGLLERQYYGVFEAFKPRNRWQEWLTARIATLMLRVDRSERVERKLRDWASYRAFDFWEEDQKLAVEELAEKLRGRNPARVVARLRQMPAGLDWLAARWRSLAGLAPDAWTDAHRERAAQLLGGDDSADPAAPGFAAAQIEAIEADRARVEEADSILRVLVESDLSDANVPGLTKLRREVRAWHRQVKWYVDQFHVEHPDRWDDPMRRPASVKVTPDGFREVNYNHFEGQRPVAPPPPPVAPHPEPKTPELPADEPKQDSLAETRRFVASLPPDPPSTYFVAVSASRSAPEPVVHDYSNEKGRGHARPLKPGEHSRAYKKKLRRARRQTNRALDGLP